MARRTTRFEGGKELEATLRELGKNVGRGVVRRSVKRAGTEMGEDMSAKAPKANKEISVKVTSKSLDGLAEYGAARASGAGSREASQAMRAARREAKASGTSKGNRFTAVVGPTSRLAHLFERGTAERHHKSGKGTGKITAQPSVRPAFDEGADRAVETIKEGLVDEIAKAAKRAAKRKARGA